MITNNLTPKQCARPSEFMLPPTDWRTNKTVGGHTGRSAFVSKAPRFPEPKNNFSECITPSQNGTVAWNAKKGPNAAGAAFRTKAPRFVDPKPRTDVVTSSSCNDIGYQTRSKNGLTNVAAACFKARTPQRPEVKPRFAENTGNVPVVTPRGESAVMSRPRNKVPTAAFRNTGSHADFLPSRDDK